MNHNTARRLTAALGAVGLLLVSLPGMAQTPTNLPKNQAELEQQLGLTADQKKKIEAVDTKIRPQVEKIQTKYKPQAEKLQKQMAALQQQMRALEQKFRAEVTPIAQKRDKEIEAILTPQQREKIKQMQAAARSQMQNGAAMGGMPAGGPAGGPPR